MAFSYRSCCKCPCTAVAYFLFLDEADQEDSTRHNQAMTQLCTVLDEDLIHPFIKNSITGLNYSSNPEGTTRVGLELFVRVIDADSSFGAPSSPVCSDAGYSTRDLDHKAVSEGLVDPDVPALGYNASEVCIQNVEQRFGHARPYSSDAGFTGTPPEGIDPETYINPYPTHFAFLADDSGSHTVGDSVNTFFSMRTYYTNQWGSEEATKRFSIVDCRGTPLSSFTYSVPGTEETLTNPIGFEEFTGVAENLDVSTVQVHACYLP